MAIQDLWRLAFLCAATGAILAPAAAAPPTPKAATTAVALEFGGLRFVALANGHTAPIAFNTPRATVEQALDAAVGHPGRSSKLEDCGAGPLTRISWPDGLAILVADGQFVGWEASQRGVTTMDGIGVGSVRAALVKHYHPHIEKSTLGTEFRIGSPRSDDMGGGLLSSPAPKARVTRLWSGITCHFG